MAFTKTSKVRKTDYFPDEVKVIATGGGAMSETLTPTYGDQSDTCDFELVQVELHLDGAATTSENFTVTLDALAGAAYDVVLHSVDISGEDDTANVVLVANPRTSAFVKGDTIDFAFANTETNTWGLVVTYRPR